MGKKFSGLPYDADESICEYCKEIVYISDMIGFHLEMNEDTASANLATAYMLIHETLMLFSLIRYYWDKGLKNDLSEGLFIKDGPLTLRGQYSKLVPLIRNFLNFSKENGCLVHIVGQEKTGILADHLETFAKKIKPNIKGELPTFAILSHETVQKEIYRTHDAKNPYGSRTNYGEKIFVKLDPFHQMVISVQLGCIMISQISLEIPQILLD